ncbi:hypothetical protein FHU36_007614 [Nonomuraea muscovyensis]|uniref:Uncharacterized protein n=1 Tax=Nonomuraea muscovyensis TaxID=1124761 RepID=A0A7X0C9I8_9ACTN|nr:hypothetical protein [Nonomuraea muscovyensis]
MDLLNDAGPVRRPAPHHDRAPAAISSQTVTVHLGAPA